MSKQWVITRWTRYHAFVQNPVGDKSETWAFADTLEEARSKLRAIRNEFFGGYPATGFEISQTAHWDELPPDVNVTLPKALAEALAA